MDHGPPAGHAEGTGPLDHARPNAGVFGNRNTVATVAAYLCCSVRTVQRRIVAGDLQCTRHGRIVRLSRSQVEAFETQHTIGPLAPTPSVENARALELALKTETRRRFGQPK